MPKPVAKIQNVQAMRGIASMMVVIFHIANLEARTYPDRLLGNFFQLGEAGVDVFFVISGFVMSTITRGNFGAASSKIFLLKRIVRIYPIYWFYTSILMFFWLFMPAIMTRSGHAVEHMSPIHSYLLIPYCEVPLIGHAWSLVNEMYFYVVFSVLLLRPEKERWFWILIWALTIPLIPTWLHTSSAFALVAFDPLTLEFVMGCGIAILIGKGFQRFGYFSLFIGLCLFFVKPSYHLVGYERVLSWGLPSALVLYAVVVLEANAGIVAPRIMRLLGDASYSIYLAHMLVANTCFKLWKPFMMPGYTDKFIVITLTTCACALAGIASYHYLEKPIIRYCSGWFSSLPRSV